MTQCRQNAADPTLLPSVPLPEVSLLPDPLKDSPHWITWKLEPDGSKLNKVPCDRHGHTADMRQGHMTLPEAVAIAESMRAGGGLTFGVGYAFTEACGLVAIDLDGAIVDGVQEEHLQWFLKNHPTWSEASVSGNGAHLFYSGRLAGKRKVSVGEHKVEVFGTSGFIALTGRMIDGVPGVLADFSPVAKLLEPYLERKTKSYGGQPAPRPTIDRSDDELLAVAFEAKNGEKIKDLYISGHGVDDDSANDLALMNHLAFYFPDAARLESVFSASALGQRSKWRDRADYRARTVSKALEGRTEFYRPPSNDDSKVFIGSVDNSDVDTSSIEKSSLMSKIIANTNHQGDGKLRGKNESERDEKPKAAPSSPAGPLPQFKSADELIEACPKLRQPIIHGLLREGETLNIIAPPKTGKSWMVLNLALAIATGREWMGLKVARGDVLIIDNELHGETMADRIPKVASALNMSLGEYGKHLFIDILRGRLAALSQMDSYFSAIKPCQFKSIVMDAWYRFQEPGTDENDNGATTAMYNLLDRHAARLGCSFICIHHTSKGNQSGKSVTDVGAGAGAQSRAADAHLVLRPHAEPGCVVAEAVARSWKQPDPICLRWDFPVWTVASGLDPNDLAGSRPRVSEDEKAEKAKEKVRKKMSDEEARVLRAIDSETSHGEEGATKTRLRKLTNWDAKPLEEVIGRLLEDGFIEPHKWVKITGNGREMPVNGYRRFIEIKQQNIEFDDSSDESLSA